MANTQFWKRIAVRNPAGNFVFFDAEEIFYLASFGHDTLVRTARKTPYRSSQRLRELIAALPSPPFFRCHESYVINLARVRTVERRTKTDFEIRLDPSVNKVIPLSRAKVAKLKGVP